MTLERINDVLDPHPDEQQSYRYPDNSNYGRELRRWNKPKSAGGMNADGFEKFPMMLHRARETQPGNGQWITHMPEPEFVGFRNEAEYMRALQRVANFNQSCQRIVHSQEEYDRVRSNGEGWRDNEKEAAAYHEQLETEVSTAALERQHQDRKLSPKAQAEAAAVDAETFEHVPEIPSGRKRGKSATA